VKLPNELHDCRTKQMKTITLSSVHVFKEKQNKVTSKIQRNAKSKMLKWRLWELNP